MSEHKNHPLRAFLSFDPTDKRLKDALLKHLKLLSHIGDVSLWSADDIRPGANSKEQLSHALASADLALLLLSASFLDSGFIRDAHLPQLLEHNRKRGLRIIPIVMRACAWQLHPWLSRLSPLPRDGTAIANLSADKRDQVLAAIVRELASLTDTLSANQSPAGASRPSIVGEPSDDLRHESSAQGFARLEGMISGGASVDDIKSIINAQPALLDGMPVNSAGCPSVETVINLAVNELLVPDFTRFVFQSQWSNASSYLIFVSLLSPKNAIFISSTTKNAEVERAEKDLLSCIRFVTDNYGSYCRHAVMSDAVTIPLSTMDGDSRSKPNFVALKGVLIVGRRRYLSQEQLRCLAASNTNAEVSMITYDTLLDHANLYPR